MSGPEFGSAGAWSGGGYSAPAPTATRDGRGVYTVHSRTSRRVVMLMADGRPVVAYPTVYIPVPVTRY